LLGQKLTAEVVTTNDTVTAADSGTVFLMNTASTTTQVTLPTAAAGLNYAFVVVGGDGATSAVRLDPKSTDRFEGCVSSSATTTFALGDRMSSPVTQATGDTVTLVGASTKWYCAGYVGTWVDVNQ